MKFFTGIYSGIAGLALMIGDYVAHGWALSFLWGWLCVPIFGAPVLSVLHAIVLWVVYRQLVGPNNGVVTVKNFGDAFKHQLMIRFGKPAWAVLVGWVLQNFI